MNKNGRVLRVGIVGGGAGQRSARLHDRMWEWWGVNATWQYWASFNLNPDRHFTRWFELHRRAFLVWEWSDADNPHTRWLRSLRQLPVYVQDRAEWADVPMARTFPWKRLAKLVPAFADYHACSIDWMLAYAIAEGAQEIALYGVEQQHSGEPLSSRACVEFWAGVAAGRGVKIWSQDGSTFKLARLQYTKTAYARDPAWLPWDDQSGKDSTIAQQRDRLARVIAEQRTRD